MLKNYDMEETKNKVKAYLDKNNFNYHQSDNLVPFYHAGGKYKFTLIDDNIVPYSIGRGSGDVVITNYRKSILGNRLQKLSRFLINNKINAELVYDGMYTDVVVFNKKLQR